MERVRGILDSFRSAWVSLPFALRAAAAALVALATFLLAWAIRPQPGLVRLGDVDPASRSRVVERLTEAGIRCEARGDALWVPADRADEAHRQLERTSSEGDADFAFVDDANPFQTKWQFERRWQIANQNRLARQIARFEFVRAAWVQIPGPAESNPPLFGSRAGPGHAAVMVELEPGAVLTRQNVEAISSIVSAAVPGLQPSEVRICDQTARLYRMDAPGEIAPSTSDREAPIVAGTNPPAAGSVPLGSPVKDPAREVKEPLRFGPGPLVAAAALLILAGLAVLSVRRLLRPAGSGPSAVKPTSRDPLETAVRSAGESMGQDPRRAAEVIRSWLTA